MQNIHKKMKVLLRSTLSKIIVLIAILGAFQGCQSPGKSTPATTELLTKIESVSKQPDEISIMTFNVENMFDNLHDKDREDFTYLPLSQKNTTEVKEFCATVKNKFYREECESLDWNNDVVEAKLNLVSGVIRSVDQGKGPDNLLMAEVENLLIVQRLVKEKLSDLGYQTVVLLEGPDMRGIDPAFISKFPQKGKAQMHLIPYTDDDPKALKYAKQSRGILEVTVTLPNKKDLTFLVGHFPSQSNPTAWRAQAITFAKKLMTEYQKKNRFVVLGGDLNITKEEEEKHQFFSTQLSEVGQVSHIVGCKQCEGSHNYRGGWSFLDVLVFSNNLNQSGYQLMPESITVVKSKNHTKPNGTPRRFDAEKKEGVADHFPLYSRLKLQK